MRRWLARGLLSSLLVAFVVVATISSAAAADRSLVPEAKLTQRPFRGIALVAIADSVVCTGFVIAPRKVVTAAHCLVRNAAKGNYRLRKGLPRNVRILRAYSGVHGGTRLQTCRPSRIWAHAKFVRRDRADQAFGSRAHDFAVLTTRKACRYPRNAVMRLWATQPFDGQLRVDQVVRMSGYPSDPRFPGMNGLNMWRTQGALQPAGSDPRLINTSGFVAQGMSGAPLWRSFRRDSPCGRAQCVIGILTECEVNARGLCKLGDSTRRAVRITPSVKRLLRRR